MQSRGVNGLYMKAQLCERRPSLCRPVNFTKEKFQIRVSFSTMVEMGDLGSEDR